MRLLLKTDLKNGWKLEDLKRKVIQQVNLSVDKIVYYLQAFFNGKVYSNDTSGL
jgi:hypothetical protein